MAVSLSTCQPARLVATWLATAAAATTRTAAMIAGLRMTPPPGWRPAAPAVRRAESTTLRREVLRRFRRRGILRGVRTLPTGELTLLLTDIDGSTRLLRELGDRFAGVLAEHRRALRAAFDHHGGVEVDTQG